MLPESGEHLASENFIRSYDGIRLDNASVSSEKNSEYIHHTESSSCMHCAKPLIFDMSARIKVKQDYLAMIEEAEREEK